MDKNMQDKIQNPLFKKPTIMQVAAFKAIKVGFLCGLSFLCNMRGMASPWVGILGYMFGLMAIYEIMKTIIIYRLMIQRINFLQSLRLSFTICILAGLLTNVVQYVYFQYFDNGLYLSSISTAMETPEYQQLLASTGLSISDQTSILEQMDMRMLMLQMIFFNLMLSVPVSIITAFFGTVIHIKKGVNNQSETTHKNR